MKTTLMREARYWLATHDSLAGFVYAPLHDAATAKAIELPEEVRAAACDICGRVAPHAHALADYLEPAHPFGEKDDRGGF